MGLEHRAALSSQVDARSGEDDGAAQHPLHATQDRIDRCGLGSSEGSPTERDREVEVGLVEGELTSLVGGDEALVHREGLSRWEEHRGRHLAPGMRHLRDGGGLGVDGVVDHLPAARQHDARAALPLPAVTEPSDGEVSGRNTRASFSRSLASRLLGDLSSPAARTVAYRAFMTCVLPVALRPRKTLMPFANERSTSRNTAKS